MNTPPLVDGIAFEGYALSMSKSETPHRPLYTQPATQNFDYAEFRDNVGLAVADGVADYEGSDMVSAIAARKLLDGVEKLGLRHYRDPVKAVEVVRDGIIPLVDKMIGDYKQEDRRRLNAATTLGAVLFTNRHIISVGIGDTPVHLFEPERDSEGSTRYKRRERTQEQCLKDRPNAISNYLNGSDRRAERADNFRRGLPTSTGPNDQVNYVEARPGQIIMIASDGLHGDHANQRIPTSTYESVINAESSSAPELIARRVSNLPRLLSESARNIRRMTAAQSQNVPLFKEDHRRIMDYQPKEDDLSVGIIKVYDSTDVPYGTRVFREK